MQKILAVFLVAIAVRAVGAQTQDFQPPPPFMPDAATMKAIEEKRAELHAAIDRLRKTDIMKVPQGARPYDWEWDPMVEVFAKAADWMVRRNEFFQKDSGKQTFGSSGRGTAGGPMIFPGLSIP